MSDIELIPILRSPDLPQTAQFYTELLGFEAEFHEDTYLLLRRDHMELHFCPPDHKDGRQTESTCYFRGAGIDALHEEWQAKSVPGLSPFYHRPWGMYEFYISDPHECLLKFGRSDREGDPPLSLHQY
jgi:catechol 2,3-dioxygenase-like lactoylglutathione lyase family enzyme